MRLLSLRLSHFRNFSELELSCPPGMSVFEGLNAQGKSNLLEAIHFVSTGRSFRTSKSQEMVQWGQERFDVRCQVEFAGVTHRIEASVGQQRGKYLSDGKPRRGSAVFGNFKAVVFANEDLDVVRQEPAVRRRFFDLFFSLVEGEYAQRLEDYLDVVKNRNRLLKEERWAELDPWDELLLREGSWVAARRKELLQAFSGWATRRHEGLTKVGEALHLQYKSSCPGETAQEIAACLREKLLEHRGHEQILKSTLVGPHRDDYEIRVGGRAARQFGSEGQKRSATLSLRMAQWDFLRDRTGEPPMILLDDVLGELDEERRNAFVDQMIGSGAQAFIVLTAAGEFLRSRADAVFKISAGTLTQEHARAARA